MKRIDLETLWFIALLFAFILTSASFLASVITMLAFGLSSLWVAFIVVLAGLSLLMHIAWVRIQKG